MEHKSKFNKNKCKKCKYHGGANINGNTIHCYYANTGKTCLHRVGKEIIDRRGNDYNNCLLYERGK